MKLAGISMVAHIFGLVLFSTLPRFMEAPPAPRTTIAEIIPASALLPPAPPGPPPQAGPTPSERAEAAKKALEPEPPPVPKPKAPDKPKPARKDIPPLEPKKPEKRPEPTVTPPALASDEPEEPAAAPPGPPLSGVGPGGIKFGETELDPGGVPTIGSSAFPYDYYRGSLVAILQSHWRRPVAPGGLRETISCRVQFTILKSGIIQDPRIAQSSGDPRLDQSALRAVVSSNPLPPLPFQYGHTSVSAEVMFELTPD